MMLVDLVRTIGGGLFLPFCWSCDDNDDDAMTTSCFIERNAPKGCENFFI